MTHDDPPDDELMSRFSDVLRFEADRVEPASDSLARIHEQASQTRVRATWKWAAPLATAAVVATVAAGAVLFVDPDEVAGPTPGTSLESSPSPTPPPGPSTSPLPTASASPTACPGKNAAAIYYVSDFSEPDPRLFREFARVSDCTDAISASVSYLLTNAAVDPDYYSAWAPDARLLSVAVDGDLATVDISRFTLGDSGGQQAIDQLVWTVTAADPGVKRVLAKIQGQPVPQEYGDWTEPQSRGNALSTLANVWILDPTEGETTGSPVTVHVYGTGFEGQVPLRVFRDGQEVASGAVTTRMGGFAEASTTFDLPPGTYEVRAYNDNGQNARLELWDSKVFSVR